MWYELIFKGALVGLMATIPLGPIGVICIQRTLSKGRKSGFISGLGASFADLVFALVAIFSLSLVMTLITDYTSYLTVVGGIFVIIIGISIFYKNPIVQIRKNRAKKGNLLSDFLSIFFLTLTNPAFIITFVGLFATFGISGDDDTLSFSDALMLLSGVLVGSALWWFTLSTIINLFRHKFRPRHLFWINRVSGVVIVVLGIVVILSILVNIPLDVLKK